MRCFVQGQSAVRVVGERRRAGGGVLVEPVHPITAADVDAPRLGISVVRDRATDHLAGRAVEEAQALVAAGAGEIVADAGQPRNAVIAVADAGILMDRCCRS